jgi:hypothetical protein
LDTRTAPLPFSGPPHHFAGIPSFRMCGGSFRSFWATLNLRTTNLFEVKRWLLGWRADAEVIGPSELRQSVFGQCKEILKKKEVLP